MAKSKKRRAKEAPEGVRKKEAPEGVRKKEKAKQAEKAAPRPPPRCGPYSSGDMILLVGEGDMSFACALLQKLGSSAFLVATNLENPRALRAKYPEARDNARHLTAAGMMVKYGVDCTQLHAKEDFMGAFTKIVFNFPHLGSDGDNVAEHQDLLSGFFASAAQCLEPLPRSEVHVTLKAGEPYNSWKVQQMAKMSGALRGDRVMPFDGMLYPGYAHCRTKGSAYAEARGFSDLNVMEGAKTYVFKLRKEALAEAGA